MPRFLLAGALLLALVPAFGVRFAWSRREIGLWFLNGGLAFSTSYSVVYWAEQYIPSGLAALLFATTRCSWPASRTSRSPVSDCPRRRRPACCSASWASP
jgi:hypothetical protein